jgi:cysteinyl-tRNA synthetase
LVYRFFCLQSHYRKALVFSYDALNNAAQAYQKLVARVAALRNDGAVNSEKFAELKKGFTEALDNDLNTSLAITALYDALKADADDTTKYAVVMDFDRVLSLGLEEAVRAAKEEEATPAADSELEAYVNEMIAARAAAKKAKNYAEADRIRAELLAKGVVLQDTPNGTKYQINQ